MKIVESGSHAPARIEAFAGELRLLKSGMADMQARLEALLIDLEAELQVQPFAAEPVIADIQPTQFEDTLELQQNETFEEPAAIEAPVAAETVVEIADEIEITAPVAEDIVSDELVEETLAEEIAADFEQDLQDEITEIETLPACEATMEGEPIAEMVAETTEADESETIEVEHIEPVAEQPAPWEAFETTEIETIEEVTAGIEPIAEETPADETEIIAEPAAEEPEELVAEEQAPEVIEIPAEIVAEVAVITETTAVEPASAEPVAAEAPAAEILTLVAETPRKAADLVVLAGRSTAPGRSRVVAARAARWAAAIVLIVMAAAVAATGTGFASDGQVESVKSAWALAGETFTYVFGPL